MSITPSGESHLKAQKAMVWSCPEHDRYWEDPDMHYCDCTFCDFVPQTCPTCETGMWLHAMDDEGNLLYEFVLVTVFDEIVRVHYFPALLDTLNKQSILLDTMFGGKDA